MHNFAYLCIKYQLMNDYYELHVKVDPPSETACDLLAYALGEAGYESFVPADDFSALKAYIPAALYNSEAAATAAASLPHGFNTDCSAILVEGRDWNEEWERNYFKPIVVDNKVVVCSSFHTDVPDAGLKIVINPKMAFGTGHHATTVLMMRSLLQGRDVCGATVVDMGTGTGILAILARMLGAAKVLAVEIDPFAAENTTENIALNLPGDENVETVCGDASALDGRGAFAGVFLANINRNIITADMGRYATAMLPGARLTVSGFYVDDRPVVLAAATAAGLCLRQTDELDNWSSMTFTKPANHRAEIEKLIAAGELEQAENMLGLTDAPTAAYLRGRIAWKQGRRAEAISAYNAAAEMQPDGPGAVALRQAREIMDFYNKDMYNP